MPSLAPIKRRDLVRYMRALGFDGPFPGKRHEAMARGNLRVAIPNPHQQDIGVNLLIRILRQAGVSREEWERL